MDTQAQPRPKAKAKALTRPPKDKAMKPGNVIRK